MFFCLAVVTAWGQEPELITRTPAVVRSERLLGPGDEVKIWALGMEEVGPAPLRVDEAGFIDVPVIGLVKAGGGGLDDLKRALVTALQKYVRSPEVTVALATGQSRPFSVVGAVNKPGLFQLQSQTTLIEAISMAGGTAPNAGATVRVTRRTDWGTVPLDAAKTDASGRFCTGEASLAALLEGRRPELNIVVHPNDVISVSPARTVFVMGEVRKAGGFVLGDREAVSVLEALSMAEGLTTLAAPSQARVLRQRAGETNRTEIAVDIRKILHGKSEDITLRQNDILFVPDSRTRNVALKALETAINIGSGVTIWRVGLPR